MKTTFLYLSLLLCLSSFNSFANFRSHFSASEYNDVLSTVEASIFKYHKMNNVQKMYFRANVKNYLYSLKFKYNDSIRKAVITKGITLLEEFDYLETKAPQKAKNFLANKHNFIDIF